MENEKRKNTSVFSKREVQDLLVAFSHDIATLKSVKEVRSKLDDLALQYTPQTRGRRLNVDFTVLQAMVDEARKRVVGNDAKNFACMVASIYNMDGQNYTNNIDAQRIRTYVEKGKIKFPDDVNFTPRVKREKVVSVVEVEPVDEADLMNANA